MLPRLQAPRESKRIGPDAPRRSLHRRRPPRAGPSPRLRSWRRDRRGRSEPAADPDRGRRRHRSDHVSSSARTSTSSRARGGLAAAGNGCTDFAPRRGSQCPRQKSINVDLGGSNDELTVTRAHRSHQRVRRRRRRHAERRHGAPTSSPAATGNDTLDGHAGVDDYFGQAGNDTIEALDRNAERIVVRRRTSDLVRNDFIDIIAECEGAKDGDGDSFSSNVDCNDANPAIFPGAREIFENGIDEDCDGRDNILLDRDADGFPVPADCNDANAAIRPGALEVKGNTVDENCDSRVRAVLAVARARAQQLVGGRPAHQAAAARGAQRAARRADRVPLQREWLPIAPVGDEDRAARPGADPARQPPAAAGDAASRGEALGPDHRARDHRADVHVLRQERRAADVDGRVPLAGRDPEPARADACA